MKNVIWIGMVAAALLPACSNNGSSGSGDTDSDDEWPGPGSGGCDGVDVMQLLADGNVSDVPVGIERCDGEIIHRYGNPSCIAEPEILCTDDDGCLDYAVDGGCPPGDACADSVLLGGCHCITPCVTDDGCDSDEICLCPFEGWNGAGPGYSINNSVRQCIPAGCRTDADCAPYRCGIVIGDCGGLASAQCHTEFDECEGADQCSGADNFSPRCSFDPSSTKWTCNTYAECD